MTIRLKGEKCSLAVPDTDSRTIGLYIRWLNDEDINWTLGKNNKVITYDHEKEYLEKAMLDKDSYHFTIMARGDTVSSSLAPIGFCSIHMEGSKWCTFGICIGEEKYRNKGIGQEALNLMLKFAFDELGVKMVYLSVLSGNEHAIHVYQKLGFCIVGRRHSRYYVHGQYQDQVLMEYSVDSYRERIK